MTLPMPAVNQPQPNTYNGPAGGYVLVVDDSEPELELLSSVLTEAGYEVKVAASGPAALDVIHTTATEIVLLDINMPDMDGYTVCKKLKENTATSDIPVIFISGYDGTIDKIKAFSVGAEDYIAKPFSIQEVVARVGNHISHRRMRRELQQTNEILERRVAERTEELSRVVEDLKDQVFERKQAEAALQQHTDRLRVLHQIDRGIMAAQSLKEIGQAALDPIFSLFPCQFASVTLFDFGPGTATLLVSTGTDDLQLQPGTRTTLADFGDIAVLRQGQPIVEDVSSSLNRSAMDWQLMAADLRTRILAPLISRDELIGCLTLGSREPGIFSVEHSAIAEEIASQLALALDNAQLHTETQKQAKSLNALHKAAEAMASTLELDTVLKQIMSELRAIMGAEGASILLRDAATNDLVFATVVSPEAHDLQGMRLPLSEGIAGWVMKEGKAVLVDDVQGDSRFSERIDIVTGMKTQSLLAAPLKSKNETIGVLEVINKAGEKFKPRDQEMLEALASSAAIAIENASLYKDLQERMQALQETQQLLVQSEKMSALGRLVASITHEVNNPLQSVQTCLTLTREELEDEQRPDKLNRYLSIIESEIERVSNIVHRLRDFYRPAANQGMQPVDVHQVLESVLALTGKQLQDSQITVQRRWGKALPHIQANADHLKQVFLNLVLNAIDAMPGGGKLQLKTDWYSPPVGSDPSLHSALCIEFKDTGEGMDANVLSHLFEPFFTTKPAGSGLGLCVSYGIIEAHQGQITVWSEPEKGAKFTIILPVTQSE